MKSILLITAITLVATVTAAPADTLECLPYRAGDKECYKATVTTHANDCEYTACPGLADKCRAEWLMANTVVDVPCENKCCPTTATMTVTQPCQPCPADCKPLYTQTLYRHETGCTYTKPAKTPALATPSNDKPDFLEGLSVMEIQLGMDDVLRGLNQKHLLRRHDATKARKPEGGLVPPIPTTNPDGSLSPPEYKDSYPHGKIPGVGPPQVDADISIGPTLTPDPKNAPPPDFLGPVQPPPAQHPPNAVPGEVPADEDVAPARPVLMKTPGEQAAEAFVNLGHHLPRDGVNGDGEDSLTKNYHGTFPPGSAGQGGPVNTGHHWRRDGVNNDNEDSEAKKGHGPTFPPGSAGQGGTVPDKDWH
ncbi:hypothetical protein SBRCBS47491_001694 [Sporothrix bragantina]|uniref:Uncharacterized protein n=1 Tax=Sporothrix bragantina TaxID=671064 RepID=A0ABP0B0T1_9PEZI